MSEKNRVDEFLTIAKTDTVVDKEFYIRLLLSDVILANQIFVTGNLKEQTLSDFAQNAELFIDEIAVVKLESDALALVYYEGIRGKDLFTKQFNEDSKSLFSLIQRQKSASIISMIMDHGAVGSNYDFVLGIGHDVFIILNNVSKQLDDLKKMPNYNAAENIISSIPLSIGQFCSSFDGSVSKTLKVNPDILMKILRVFLKEMNNAFNSQKDPTLISRFLNRFIPESSKQLEPVQDHIFKIGSEICFDELVLVKKDKDKFVPLRWISSRNMGDIIEGMNLDTKYLQDVSDLTTYDIYTSAKSSHFDMVIFLNDNLYALVNNTNYSLSQIKRKGSLESIKIVLQRIHQFFKLRGIKIEE